MLKLRYQGTTTIPIEAEIITPDRLAALSLAQIAKLPLQLGNTTVQLGDFFSLDGDSSDREIRLEGDCSRIKRLGESTQTGRLIIDGPAGMHVGAAMTGGTIHVHGDVGDGAGVDMRGGFLHIHGNAGNLVGAGHIGSRAGMRGGILIVNGNAGREAGSSMRRGLIAIGGDTGEFPGVSLRAGSIFIFGKAGARLGAGMKRGTLALFSPAPPLLPSFRFSCAYAPVFLYVYLNELVRLGFAPARVQPNANYRRYCGDLVSLGKGEILVRE